MGGGIVSRLRPWLLGLGLGCMLVYLLRERVELARLLAGANTAWLLASLPVALMGNSAVAGLFGQLLSGHGVVIGRSRLYPLFFYSNLAKYIPGRVWSVLYQHLSLPGTTARSTVLLVNLDLTIWQLAGCGILALFLGYYHAPLAAVGLAALVGTPLIRGGFCARLGTAMGDLLPTRLTLETSYRPPTGAVVLGQGLLFWSCFVVSQGLLMVGLLAVPWDTALVLVGCLAAAWVVGTLAVFTPAGIGIREVVFVMLARHTGLDMTVDTLAILALGLRLWQVIHEMLGAALVALLVADHEPLSTRR